MKNAIWSRRNFITISSLAAIAGAVPVAAVKAVAKRAAMTVGDLWAITMAGERFYPKGRGETDEDWRLRIERDPFDGKKRPVKPWDGDGKLGKRDA